MDARGFSVIELMVLLVVAGIVFAFAMPSWRGFSGALAQRQAGVQLLQAIQTARQTAVTGHRPVYMRFGTPPTTTGITSYKIHIDKDADGIVDANESNKTYTLPSGVTLSNVALAPVDSICYAASGTLLPNSTGGVLVYTNGTTGIDTLMVSSIGIPFRP